MNLGLELVDPPTETGDLVELGAKRSAEELVERLTLHGVHVTGA